MNNNKVLSLIAYLSVFIFPVITPLIILLVSKDNFVKKHSKKALVWQVLPIISYMIMLGITLLEASYVGLFISIGLLIVTLITSVVVMIIGAIKVARHKEEVDGK